MLTATPDLSWSTQNPNPVASPPVSIPGQAASPSATLPTPSNRAPVLSPGGPTPVVSPRRIQTCQTVEISQDMQDMLVAVNNDRANNGRSPLQYDDCMNYLAYEHDIDMSSHNLFSHVGSDNLTISGRIARLGIEFRRIGENIAMGQTQIAEVQKDFMASDGHRDNILNAEFEVFGYCLSVGKNGKTYHTQTFAKLSN
uniref:Allergen V5/Tpx1 family protein putative n=1 Tax=Albugo laibachii Nc14 TaxID=890382 RepID=F0WQ19_9STRA|nr:Allergen V5/Tpx1 family protein putative [Albugo laibachii Nc14]|eukprot:CCA23424.1 Allergen V5/Tpx1 family protein putative [Albugo laibachii Nc14]